MNNHSTKGNQTREKIMEYLKSQEILICPVSMQEIADAVGLSSTSAVSHHLNELEKMGKVSTPASSGRRKVRGIQIVHPKKIRLESNANKTPTPVPSE